MTQDQTIIHANVIAEYAGRGEIVLIERLKGPRGLVLPGGKRKPAETLQQTATRTFREKTGLAFFLRDVLSTYLDSERDPRGIYVSTVFIGTATGVCMSESRDTRVRFMNTGQILRNKELFVKDYFMMLCEYFRLLRSARG